MMEDVGREAPASKSAEEALRGTVLNIQRFSTQDGPGVRTTVFLKGCTNHCAWCHNPESMRLKPELQVYPDRCIGCGRCVEVCSEGAHLLIDGEKQFDRELCQMCGRCAEDCFAGGLVIAGKEMSVDEVMCEILQDETYYRHSEGGVTFSGGEPVIQREFLLALLRRCKKKGIHTAIETAANYNWRWVEEMLPYVDLVMCDLKIMTSKLHKKFVGNDGERIQENLRKLGDSGVPMIVRTPVVGGVNDAKEEIASIAHFVGSFEHLLYYELLTYHPLGASKRESLGLPKEGGFYAPDKARMDELVDVARTFIHDVRS
ncbi:MAG: glycyl-radical enzyme activating protein [Candidatus Latescibacteria bacterium]|nr:glycyl-radical enzyme activating protein [Candidatus Latescibacterota bacterium]